MIEKLIDLLVSIFEYFIPFEVIDAYQRGLVLRLGTFNRELEPGFHWIIPFRVERVMVMDVVPATLNLKAQSLTTADGKSVVIGAVVTHKIHRIQKALLECNSVHNVLEDSCYGHVASLVSSHTWDEVRAETFNELLTEACRKRAFTFGVEITRVQLSDVAPSRALRLYQATA